MPKGEALVYCILRILYKVTSQNTSNGLPPIICHKQKACLVLINPLGFTYRSTIFRAINEQSRVLDPNGNHLLWSFFYS